ncbi:MAG: DmsE family decaheme c-type cytochrome [Terriglobales bacterium]
MHASVRLTKIARFLGVTLFILAVWASAQQNPAAQPKPKKEKNVQTAAASPVAPGATYVGADTCKGCHEDIYTKSFQNTPHFALIKDGKHGCEDCHGPGSAHVEGGGDPTKIIRLETLSAAQASDRCMSCHQANLENANFHQSIHLSAGVGCLSCHSPHHATAPTNLLVKAQPLLCYGCHTQQKAEFARPFRHRVDVGLLQCTDCHNPHGTQTQKQLRTVASGFDICTKCHTEKKGPFVFEHPPVKQEGCTSCHVPHGSTNPRLLRVSFVNNLCLQCHTAVAGNNIPGIPSFHNQNTKYQSCTTCHTQIHGSNFDEYFFK